MLKIKFVGKDDFVLAGFKKVGEVVELSGENIPQLTTGFDVYSDLSLIGEYEDYTTIFRVVDGAVQFSNDGSVWVPTITFTSNGGELDGELVQHESKYQNLTVPTPVDSDDWKFSNWDKTIPSKGNITEDVTYTAIFEDLRPEPEPTPSVDERIEDLETSQADQDEVLEYLMGISE